MKALKAVLPETLLHVVVVVYEFNVGRTTHLDNSRYSAIDNSLAIILIAGFVLQNGCLVNISCWIPALVKINIIIHGSPYGLSGSAEILFY